MKYLVSPSTQGAQNNFVEESQELDGSSWVAAAKT